MQKNGKEQQAPRMTNDRALEMEALARARYFAMSQRRTMPPRCNPLGILFIVLSLGLIFIGVTMTTIAHWPGVTQIGENPLKIAGPVLLAVGAAMFILVIVGVCYCNSRDRKNWDTKITNMALERASSISKEPLVPGHSLSIITSSFQQPRDSYSSSNPAYNGNINARNSMQPPNYNARNPQFPPNTTNYPRGKSGSILDVSASYHDSSFESQPLDSAAPAPLRHQKKRQALAGSLNASANVSAEVGEADMSIPGVYYPIKVASQPPPTYNAHLKKSRNQSHHAPGVSMSQEPIRDAIERGRRVMEPDYRGQGVPRDQGLRLHIKTQPGTAVYITPTATPPSGGYSNRASMDTEI